MRAVVSNCQGVGSPLTVPQLKETVNFLSPSVVFLSETKNKRFVLEKVRRKLGFEHLHTVEPM